MRSRWDTRGANGAARAGGDSLTGGATFESTFESTFGSLRGSLTGPLLFFRGPAGRVRVRTHPVGRWVRFVVSVLPEQRTPARRNGLARRLPARTTRRLHS